MALALMLRRFLLTDKLFTQRTLPLPALHCLVAFLAGVGQHQANEEGSDRTWAANAVRNGAFYLQPATTATELTQLGTCADKGDPFLLHNLLYCIFHRLSHSNCVLKQATSHVILCPLVEQLAGDADGPMGQHLRRVW